MRSKAPLINNYFELDANKPALSAFPNKMRFSYFRALPNLFVEASPGRGANTQGAAPKGWMQSRFVWPSSEDQG